ncbi:sensor histidine kinase [Sphingobium lignivorans]|nr:PAS domain-containing sensor histidine kinase [Sphingobium lignivorans]
MALSLWALLTGLSLRRSSRQARGQADRLADLLQSAPAIPMLVRSDGRIEAPDRLANWLGRTTVPAFLSELVSEEGGLEPEHSRSLAAEVKAAQRGGRSFVLPIRARGSSRTLLVRGGPAGPDLASPGTIVLWIFDATESQSQIEELRKRVGDYREALEALSGVIEAAPMPVWHRGADQRLSLVNSAYVRSVDGESAQQVIEQGIELVEAVDGLSPSASAARAADANAPTARMVPVTIDGERRLMRVVDVPLGPVGVAGYAIDMQELEEARAELRHLVQANRDMLDRLSAGVVQFGSNHLLQFCNQPFLSIFGLSPEMATADTHFDRVLDAMRDAGLVPETADFPAWRKEKGEWFQSPNAREEHWRLRDGVHMRVYAQPLPDGGLLLIFEDRTEHVQLSSARDTLLRVRTATLDNLFEAIAVFAADGRLHLWNSRFRQIWAVQEVLLATHPRVDELMSALADRLARPQQSSLVHQLIRAATVERRQRGGRIAFADGRYFEFAAIPLPDGNALFVMLDISDSRRIEQALRDRNEALEDADRVKTAFVSNMSYELRTPLTSIAGFAEMMQSGYAGELTPQAREYVDAIIASTMRLARLIDNVLDLTQGAAGGLPIERKPVEVEPLVTGLAAAFEEKAQARGVTIALALRPNLGTIVGDERRIRQAVEHVVDNAVRFVQDGGRVLIHGEGTHKSVRIIVSDDGPGIESRLQARLFDSFARFGRNAAGETTGLGLPLVRQFVESHGGSVSLVSEPGQGTIVTIELPRGE